MLETARPPRRAKCGAGLVSGLFALGVSNPSPLGIFLRRLWPRSSPHHLLVLIKDFRLVRAGPKEKFF
jgi:hypothetical protein